MTVEMCCIYIARLHCKKIFLTPEVLCAELGGLEKTSLN